MGGGSSIATNECEDKSSKRTDALTNYCYMKHDHFEYLNVISTGGFGLVLQCRHILTGMDYAMKVQPKAALLRHCRLDKTRVTSELAASVVFCHPYITFLTYAFHTETLTMLVSPISACGDLHRSLNLCPHKRMDMNRVVFYTAEIVSALMYMHRHDIMYRDLKPGNVLLNADGHVMLADFGSLAGIYTYLCYCLFYEADNHFPVVVRYCL